MEPGARLSGLFGAAYEWQGDTNGHFKVIKKDGQTFFIPGKDVLMMAAAIIRPRLNNMISEVLEKLFK